MNSQTEERNPYVGPRPFERQHAQQFYGREREVRDLLALVTANRFVLLYAASGAGKTSLLNAGLIPALEEDAFEILPSARVRGAVTGDIPTESIPNVYVFNAIMSWATEGIDPRALVGLSLSDLFRIQITERPNGQQDEESQPLPRVVIFDQFEELFTTYAERWEDREGFFQQLADALTVDPYLRVVVAIREDFVAQLDSYAHLIPGTLQTRYHIEQLNAEKALSAIKNPLVGTPYHYEEGLAEWLVEELRKSVVKAESGETVVVVGQYVEPVQLQVVCRSLLDRVMLSGDSTISEEDVQALGGVTRPLSDFYETAVLRAADEADVPEVGLRSWFEEHLITPAGTRGIVYRGSETTADIPNSAVDILENAHLIRGQWRAGARWYELTHDRLITPIQESNQHWREERQARRTRRITSYASAALGILLVAVLVLAIRNAAIRRTAGSPEDVAAEMTLVAESTSIRATSTVIEAASTAQAGENAELQATSTAQANENAIIHATSTAVQATSVAQATQADELVSELAGVLDTEQIAQLAQELDPVQLAQVGVTSNADWTHYVQTFDDVEMVLVPKGCFTMGSDSNEPEMPLHEQCIEKPFWIDRFEVTNGQFGSVGTNTGPDLPRDTLDWFLATDYCASRNARLPTEVEWEYAARGPDSLLFPWGNDFLERRAVYVLNSHDQTANVGNMPAGASWVGALDMSGNVWEWVSSTLEPYPYDATDGREADTAPTSRHVLRGGSYRSEVGLLRAATRGWSQARAADIDFGVRCARDFSP